MDEIKRYFIKPGYRFGVRPGQKIMFEGEQDSAESSMISQYEVYEYASRLIKNHRLRSVLDIGCGYGMKLKKLILSVCQDITGIDEADTISWCKQHYDFGTWSADNLEDPKVHLGRTFDLIISADVIEHLVNPDKLLEAIKRFASKDTFIILSTPERDATRGKDDMGPPSNPLHAREWNFDEFRKYIEYNRFVVLKHFRSEPWTSLEFQSGRFRHVMIIRRVRLFFSILNGVRGVLLAGVRKVLRSGVRKSLLSDERKDLLSEGRRFLQIEGKRFWPRAQFLLLKYEPHEGERDG